MVGHWVFTPAIQVQFLIKTIILKIFYFLSNNNIKVFYKLNFFFFNFNKIFFKQSCLLSLYITKKINIVSVSIHSLHLIFLIFLFFFIIFIYIIVIYWHCIRRFLIVVFFFLIFFTLISIKLNNFYYSISTFNSIILAFFFFNIIITVYFLFYSTIDIINKCVLALCVLISYIVFLCLNTNIKEFYLQYILLYFFSIITYYLVTANNLITMFIAYEFLMFPSLVLIFKSSYSEKSYSSIFYFFIWTQVGSFTVLLSALMLMSLYLVDLHIYKLNLIKLDPTTVKIIRLFFFIGFGIKVPVFPFYRWLIQVHVEAPSGFSIFLSGFLVKTALFFYVKVTLFLPHMFPHLEILPILAIISSSLKFWFQTDIKKTVAYATVQEMNMIYFIINFVDQKASYIGIIFILSHGFLSTFMFYIVELIYKRFSTRNIEELGALWTYTPNLAKIVYLKILIFIGIPGFAKFTIEIIFYMYCLRVDTYLTIFLIIVVNFIGSIGYIKVWFSVLFSIHPTSSLSKEKILDLSTHEMLICIFLLVTNIILNIFFI